MKTNTTTTSNQPTTNNVTITIIDVKNIELSELKTTANSVVLLQQRFNVNGNTIKGVAVNGLKKTDLISIVKHLLIAIVAEKKQELQFNNEFATINNQKSGITAKKYLTRFLNTNLVFRTDSTGKIATAVKLNGLKLKDTALKITDKHLLATTDRNNLRAVLHHHTKAVVAQFRYLEDLQEAINEMIKETTATEPAPTTKGKKATTTATTLTTEPATATA